MKKVLYGTTALVAAGMFATTASAADPIKLGIGGSMQQWIGYISPESDLTTGGANAHYNSVAINTDTQLAFTGETKLDNGWTVSAEIDIDTANNNAGPNATVNQEFLQVGTGFGTIQAGLADVITTWEKGAPDVGIGLGDAPRWAPRPQNWNLGDGTRSTSFADAMTNATTAMAGYISPDFGGFQASVSFMPGLTTGGGIASNAANNTNVESHAMGAGWNGDLGGVALGVGVGYAAESGAANTASRTLWNGGLEIGFGPVTVAGSYLDVNSSIYNTTAINDTTMWDAGVRYDVDAWNLSLSYMNETFKRTTTDEEELATWMASARYNLGGGVTWRTSIFNVDQKDKRNSADNNNASTTGVVTGLNLAF